MTTHDQEILDSDEHSKDPAWYRETIERMKAADKEKDAELAALRAEKRARILDEAGLDPVVRKAIEKDIDRGDFDGDVAADSVRAYAAEEYGWVPPDGDDLKPDVPEDVQRRLESQQARDDLNASSKPRGEPDDSPEAEQAKVDEQLEAGDIQGAILSELTQKVDRAR
jgi:hypothetical protein